MCDYCSWIDHVLAKVCAEVESTRREPPQRVDPVIVVHGGAGRIPAKERAYMLKEVKNAAIEAYVKLVNGQSALDAVELAICHMEAKKYFNCGRGGSSNAVGEVVMDAGLMATDYECGFVGAVRDIEHPITLAKKVLRNSSNVLIVERGAQKFAATVGIPLLPPGFLVAEETPAESIYSTGEGEAEGDEASKIQRFDPSYYDDYAGGGIDEENKNEPKVCPPNCAKENSFIDYTPSPTSTKSDEEEEQPGDADSGWNRCRKYPEDEPIFLQVSGVGAVAFDRKRRLASGTSTAGQPGKIIGHVSAVGTVPGCGVYVDENGGASVSGADEPIYTFAPARKIVRRLENESTKSALMTELRNFEDDTDEIGIGAIAINRKGESYVHFKCQHFPWATCYNGIVYYGCVRNERLKEEVNVLERPLDCMCESNA